MFIWKKREAIFVFFCVNEYAGFAPQERKVEGTTRLAAREAVKRQSETTYGSASERA